MPNQHVDNTNEAVGELEAYKAFDAHQPGWIKVELEPAHSLKTRR